MVGRLMFAIALAGCAVDVPAEVPPLVAYCDAAGAAVAGTQPALNGTKTVTKIVDPSGKSMQAMTVNGQVWLSVGDYARYSDHQTLLTTIAGPTNGQCSVDGVYTVDAAPPTSTPINWTVYFTAIWPESYK